MMTRYITVASDTCFRPAYENTDWQELELHLEEQDTRCDGWKRLVELVETTVDEGYEVLNPRAVIDWDDLERVVTLPKSIGKLKSLKGLDLYASRLSRLPPEIGDMQALEIFDPYTSMRLHWMPYEITRCKRLKRSRVSTRTLYGNYKFRPPFPRLPVMDERVIPPVCSVCRRPFKPEGPLQVWISLWVGTDVLPLLVNACSQTCIDNLPEAAPGYVPGPHMGGLDLAQPDPGFVSRSSST